MIRDFLLTQFLRIPHFKGKTRLEGLLLWRDRHPTTWPVYGGLRMELDYGEWTQLQLIRGKWLEPKTLATYERLLKPGDVFLDVGAHVGFHSIVGRRAVGPDGLVVAVEPQPYNAQKILRNWRANAFTNLKLFIAAVGDTEGFVELPDQDITDRSVLTLCSEGGKNEAQRFTVPLMRLETILGDAALKNRPVKLMKMDVEGFEYEALSGMGSRQPLVQNILFEVIPRTPEATVRRIVEHLEGCGYQLRTVDGVAWKIGNDIPENNLVAALS
jgi:FkbM family methyltransferase